MIAATRDAIITALNTQSFTPTITAAAAYEATVDLELTMMIGEARLLVIPRDVENDATTFDGTVQDRAITFDVILQYHARTLTTAELDPYLALAESITTYMLGETAVEAADKRCTEVKWPSGTWDADHLEKFKVLTIVLACTFSSIH